MPVKFEIQRLNTGDDQIPIGLLFVIAIVSVLLVIATVVFTVGLYDWQVAAEREKKVFNVTEVWIVPGSERTALEAEQTASINQYGWRDERYDIATVPMDVAKQVYIDGMLK